jgi:hypothetical protein
MSDTDPLPPDGAEPAAPLQPPAWWQRAVLYVLAWVPVTCMLIFFTLKFSAIFDRLAEKGELHPLTHVVWALGRLNQAYFYLPLVLAFAIFCALGEAAFLLAPEGRHRGFYLRAWRAGVIGLGLFAWFASVKACMLPPMKMEASAWNANRAQVTNSADRGRMQALPEVVGSQASQ